MLLVSADRANEMEKHSTAAKCVWRVADSENKAVIPLAPNPPIAHSHAFPAHSSQISCRRAPQLPHRPNHDLPIALGGPDNSLIDPAHLP